MATAVQVFAIPELLEAILLQLPPEDLLLSQRVDRTFRDTVKGSINLQKALFFRITQPTTSTISTHLHESALNPFLLYPTGFDTLRSIFDMEPGEALASWSYYPADHDIISWGFRLLELARSYTAFDGDLLEPSWLDMYLRNTSRPAEIDCNSKFDDGYCVGCSMKIQAPSMRDLLEFAVSIHAIAERNHKTWGPASSEDEEGDSTVFSLDEAIFEASFTAAQRDRIIEEPKFTASKQEWPPQ